jgi:hypothetical protein
VALPAQHLGDEPGQVLLVLHHQDSHHRFLSYPSVERWTPLL